jgi:hypothetical protein
MIPFGNINKRVGGQDTFGKQNLFGKYESLLYTNLIG